MAFHDQNPSEHVVDAVPCTECGSEPDIESEGYRGWLISCPNCYDGPHSSYVAWGLRPSDAVDDWNRYQNEENWP